MVADAYALSNDAASCWKALRRARRLTAAETGMLGSAMMVVVAGMLGDEQAQAEASAEASRSVYAYLRERGVVRVAARRRAPSLASRPRRRGRRGTQK